MYENQDEIGHALHKVFKEGKIKREDVWITSKVAPPSTFPQGMLIIKASWQQTLHGHAKETSGVVPCSMAEARSICQKHCAKIAASEKTGAPCLPCCHWLAAAGMLHEKFLLYMSSPGKRPICLHCP